MSVSEYIMRYRLDIASRMLVETDFSIGQIGYSCGFRDMNPFSKMFKAKYLNTPSRYRNIRTIS